MGDLPEPADSAPPEAGVASTQPDDPKPLFFTPPGTREHPDEPVLDPPLPVRRWQAPHSDGPRHAPQAYRTWRPRPRVTRMKAILLGIIGLLVVAAGAVIAVATWSTQKLDSNVHRVANVFPSGTRPAPAPGLNFLVVGLDPNDQSSSLDAIMLLHVEAGHAKSQAVYLPPYAEPEAGGPTLDATFSTGGPRQLVSAVERFTKIRIDHYGQMDFNGFKTITDSLGGVDVDVPEAYANGSHHFPAGGQHLTGAEALAYVQDDSKVPAPNAAQRQQVMITALFTQVSRQGLLSNPTTLDGALQSMARSFTVDDTLGAPQLVQLLWSLRGLAPPQFVTAPVTGTAVLNGRVVATFDPARDGTLWKYLRHDSLAKHLSEFR